MTHLDFPQRRLCVHMVARKFLRTLASGQIITLIPLFSMCRIRTNQHT